MAVLQNVARLDHKTAYKHIQAFLLDCRSMAANTEKAYEFDIRQFFKYMRNKDIEDLTFDELIFDNADMKLYRNYLVQDYRQPSGDKYSNMTINRKINTIISLYGSMKRDGLKVDPDLLKLKELPDDSKPIGFLTVEEVDTMLTLLGETRKDREIRAFITLALHTSMRKTVMLNLEKSDFSRDHEGNYVISKMDKGKQVYREVNEDVYHMLMGLANEVNSNKIFTIPVSTLEYNFKSLCSKIGIDEMRNVSLHSLKKAGVNFVKEFTNDLHAAQEQGGHSNPATTAKYYLKRPKNLAGKLLGTKINKDVFKDLTHAECIQMLASFGNGIGFQLKMKAQQIIDAR